MNQVQKLAGVVGAFALTGVTMAQAALPTEATAAFTALSTNVTDILAVIWPIVTLATGGFILIGLFKKGAHKAV